MALFQSRKDNSSKDVLRILLFPWYAALFIKTSILEYFLIVFVTRFLIDNFFVRSNFRGKGSTSYFF